MTSTFNALLSDIYRLLSLYDEEDLLEASRSHRADPLIREALRALSKAARGTRRPSVRADAQKSNGHAHGVNEDSGLTSMLMRAVVDTPTEKIFDIFGQNGILVERKPKESRERLTRRVVSLTAGLGPSRKRKLLEDLAERAGSQTAGWISVLRNRG